MAEVLRLPARAVIFDMDGVITNTMPEHFQAWKIVLGEAGIAVTEHDVYQNEGQKGSLFLRELFARLNRAEIPGQQDAMLARKEALFKDIVQNRFIEGAKEFLEDLSARGFRLALVTGTSRHEVERILPQALRQRFAVMITADDVTEGKPHPEPFLRALERLKLSAADAVVVENAPLGIAAANAAGLLTLALESSLSREYLGAARAVYPTIADLRAGTEFILRDGDPDA